MRRQRIFRVYKECCLTYRSETVSLFVRFLFVTSLRMPMLCYSQGKLNEILFYSYQIFTSLSILCQYNELYVLLFHTRGSGQRRFRHLLVCVLWNPYAVDTLHTTIKSGSVYALFLSHRSLYLFFFSEKISCYQSYLLSLLSGQQLPYVAYLVGFTLL